MSVTAYSRGNFTADTADEKVVVKGNAHADGRLHDKVDAASA